MILARDHKVKRKPSYAVQREALWRKKQRKCHYCNRGLTLARGREYSMTLDHRIPLSRGGLNKPHNYAPACPSCNNEKGAMTEAEYRFARSRKPTP